MPELRLEIGGVPPTMICEMCGERCQKRGNGTQKYCETCSEIADTKRKRTWAQRNPLTKDQLRHIRNNRAAAKTDVLTAWSGRSSESARSIDWMSEPAPTLAWAVRVKVPFLYRMSKNAIFTTNRFGHVALRREAKAIRHEITLVVRESLRRLDDYGFEIKSNKLWIDLLVQKPNHRGDAINVVDLVCDAIKDACGLDDRWFSIRRIDWEIVKDQPYLFIGIGQEECEEGRVCSACGAIQDRTMFPKNSHDKEGISRICKPCLKVRREVQGKSRVIRTEQEGLFGGAQ